MRILVQPEQLRGLAGQLRRRADELRDLQRRLGNALSRMDWATRLRASIDGEVGAARGRASALADEAERIARQLETRADAFEDADRQGVSSLSRLVAPAPTSLATLPKALPWPFAAVALPLITWPVLIGLRWPPKLAFSELRLPRLPWMPDPRQPEIPSGEPEQDSTSGGSAIAFGDLLESQTPTPTPVPLNEAASPSSHSATDGCAMYAQSRRPGLGPTGGRGGAADYIDTYSETSFQITDQDTDLTTKVAVGYAVVWPRGHADLLGYAGETNGHVAIVERVEGDYVIVSQAGWGTKTEMKIPRDKLATLYLIP